MKACCLKAAGWKLQLEQFWQAEVNNNISFLVNFCAEAFEQGI